MVAKKKAFYTEKKEMNLSFLKISWKKSLLRNIFFILQIIIKMKLVD